MGRNESASEGAVAVMVAFFIAFVGVALLAFALDMGSLRQSQRALVTDTDAAALAGAIELAQDWMQNGGECGDRAAARTEAERVLAVNNPEDEVVSTDADCEPNPATAADFSGWVQMVARQPSPDFVSGQELSAGGNSTAEFVLDIADFAEGLAICADLFPSSGSVVPEFTLDNGNLAIPYALNAVLTYEEQLGSACGLRSTGNPGTPGGWGWITSQCDVDLAGPGTYCSVNTGNDLINGFESNIDQVVRFPIFDAWDGGTGGNAKLRIIGYMDAVVEAQCRIPGANSNSAEDPDACNRPSNLEDRFRGQQSHFIVVSDPQPWLFRDPDPRMFDTATYSICDVQGDRRFCRSRG